MKWFSTLMCAAAIGSLTLVPAQASSLSKTDANYLTAAMQLQLGRYALASLAVKNAGSSKLKAFAKSMQSDASAQTRALDAIAKQDGVPAAKQPDVRASYHYSQLSGLHGSQFDSRFVQDLQIGDSLASERHSSEAQSGQDAKLKAYAHKRVQALKNEESRLGSLGK